MTRVDEDEVTIELDGPGGRDLEPRQGVLRRAGRDQARPRRLLRGRPRAAAGGHGRAAGAAAALPRRAPTGSSFFQKRVPQAVDRRGCRRRSSARPTARRRTRSWPPTSPTSRGRSTSGCLGFHVWPTRADDPEHADELRIDLDPTPGVDVPDGAGGGATRCGRCSTSSASRGWPKTTGNRGIHVYVRLEPRWDSYEVRAAAVALARELERRRPDLVTAAWWKEERGRRVFVDFNQNAPAQDGLRRVVRAGPARRAGVDAVPLGRARRRRSTPTSSRSPVVPARVAADGDPWAGDVRAAAVARAAARPVTSATWPPA